MRGAFSLGRRARASWNAGVAALEFALLAPVLVVLMIGVTDFSMAYHQQLQVSSALGAAAQYAFTKGQTETGATLTSDVSTFVRGISPVTLSAVTVLYNNGLSATACYCVTGATATYSGPFTCGAACSDGSGSTAGKYVSIAGSFSYAAMFPPDQVFFQTAMSQTVTARLK